MASRITGCRELGRGPGDSWPGDGKMFFTIWPPAGSRVPTLYWFFSDLPILDYTLFLASIICHVPSHLDAWIEEKVLSSRSAWNACGSLCNTNYIPPALAQTKTRLCMSHHSHWHCICPESENGWSIPAWQGLEQISYSEVPIGVWQQVEESTDCPL